MKMGRRHNNNNIDYIENNKINKEIKKSRYDEAKVNHDYDNIAPTVETNRMYGNFDYHTYQDHKELILKYRTMATFSDVSTRIRKIVNACIIINYEQPLMKLKFREPNNITKVMKEKYTKKYTEFLESMDDYDRELKAMFKQWFVDGRLYIRKIREEGRIMSYDVIHPFNITKHYVDKIGNEFNWIVRNLSTKQNEDVPKDDIIFVVSGEYDGITPVSHLHRSMKIAYELNMLKNSLMIHRIVRAPLRYAVYIDVGKMDPDTAFSLINRYKNEYNLERFFDEDGIIAGANKPLMSENFWFSRHENKNTELDTVGGDVNISDIEDVEMFIRDLNESMAVPMQRADQEEGGGDIYLNGNMEDMSQDERDFRKYIMDLRYSFSKVNLEMFKDHLLSGDIDDDDTFKKHLNSFTFEYSEDEHYERRIRHAKIKGMVELLDDIKDYLGLPDSNNEDRMPIFSMEYVTKTILGFTEAELAEMKEQVIKEKKDGFWWYKEGGTYDYDEDDGEDDGE
jgi:hypothetical protein